MKDGRSSFLRNVTEMFLVLHGATYRKTGFCNVVTPFISRNTLEIIMLISTLMTYGIEFWGNSTCNDNIIPKKNYYNYNGS